jgi:hypothetical protein
VDCERLKVEMEGEGETRRRAQPRGDSKQTANSMHLRTTKLYRRPHPSYIVICGSFIREGRNGRIDMLQAIDMFQMANPIEMHLKLNGMLNSFGYPNEPHMWLLSVERCRIRLVPRQCRGSCGICSWRQIHRGSRVVHGQVAARGKYLLDVV